jgi:hypothetical protein
MFKEGQTPDVWICDLCPHHVEIRINPDKYYRLRPGKRLQELRIEADKHVFQEHKDWRG